MSNMYDWIDRTYNPLRGECPHKCGYCYAKNSRVKKLYTGEPRLIESVVNKSLGTGHFYFVGSMIDIFAEKIPSYTILKILEQCRKYENRYLFQSKNPWRFEEFRDDFPKDTVLGTTIETNRQYPIMGNTEDVTNRIWAMDRLSERFDVIVTVEPLMDFDLPTMTNWILFCNPKWVNIGADSKKNNLPEPGPEKIRRLISELRGAGIEVKIKDNLKRLL